MMKIRANTRTEKAFLNTSSEMMLELVTAVCSFILPRLILSYFGSSYNGITLSISQFIGCVALLKAGIGSVTRAALYRPLSKNDSIGISEIVNATQGFMRKVAVIFALSVIAFACLYPFIVDENFSWGFSASLVLIIASSTFAQYFWGLPYQMVLQADQRSYIISLVTILSTISNTCIAALLIISGFGIHAVKLGSAIVFTLPPLFYYFYVRRRYSIVSSIPPNYQLIAQRWDAFGHQLANFVNTNTDLIVVTIILGVKSVSVYSIYYMIVDAIKKFVMAFTHGITAAFGNMIAKGEMHILRSRFEQFEVLIYYLSTTLLLITIIMLQPFIALYTEGVSDISYHRPVFGTLVCISVYLACIKVPYEQLVFAAGKFRQTRNAAFVEAGIHITLSVVLACYLGLNGIVLGFIISAIYRITRYHLFLCKNVLPRNTMGIFRKIFYSLITALLVLGITAISSIPTPTTYIAWVIETAIVSLAVLFLSTIVAFLLFRNEMGAVYTLLRGRFKKSTHDRIE